MRVISNIVGGIAIVATSFFGTLFLLDRYKNQDPLAREANSLRAALKEYRAAKGAYPIVPDGLIVDLKKELVLGGYLRPGSHPEPDTGGHYVSFDGKSYGLLFYIDRTSSDGTPCVIEVDTTGPTEWWGRPPKCEF
jgi:hypothetical protein